MATFGSLWQVKATFVNFSNSWQLIATFGKVWPLFATFGSLWQVMATFVNFSNSWQLMATFGKVWLLFATIGSLWLLLAHYGNFWQHFGDPCNLESFSAEYSFLQNLYLYWIAAIWEMNNSWIYMFGCTFNQTLQWFVWEKNSGVQKSPFLEEMTLTHYILMSVIFRSNLALPPLSPICLKCPNVLFFSTFWEPH